jgi:ABC-type Zn2+ transport system substrate-binding protein/surface adhesin
MMSPLLQSLPAKVIEFRQPFLRFLIVLDCCGNVGTKREVELDDVSPSKLKALKAAAQNGSNGEAPVGDNGAAHKNGDDHAHDDDDDDDDVSQTDNELRQRTKIRIFF